MSVARRESRATTQNRQAAQRTLNEQLALDDGTRLAFLGVQWGKTKETTILKLSLYSVRLRPGADPKNPSGRGCRH